MAMGSSNATRRPCHDGSRSSANEDGGVGTRSGAYTYGPSPHAMGTAYTFPASSRRKSPSRRAGNMFDQFDSRDRSRGVRTPAEPHRLTYGFATSAMSKVSVLSFANVSSQEEKGVLASVTPCSLRHASSST